MKRISSLLERLLCAIEPVAWHVIIERHLRLDRIMNIQGSKYIEEKIKIKNRKLR